MQNCTPYKWSAPQVLGTKLYKGLQEVFLQYILQDSFIFCKVTHECLCKIARTKCLVVLLVFLFSLFVFVHIPEVCCTPVKRCCSYCQARDLFHHLPAVSFSLGAYCHSALLSVGLHLPLFFTSSPSFSTLILFMRGAHSIILSPYISFCPPFSLYLSAPEQDGGRREERRVWVGEMDRLGESDKRSISRPSSPGRTTPIDPPISLFPLTSIFFFYSALHSSAPLPSLLFFPTFVAFKPDKGSLRIHFVCISACKCLPPSVYVCAHLCLSAQLISHEGQLPKVPLKSFQWLSITRAHMHTSERKHKRRPQKSFSFSPAKSTLLVIVGQCVIRVGPYLRIHLAFVSLLLKHHREGLLSTPFPLSHPPPIIPMCLQNLPATAYCPNEVVY